MFVMPAPRPRFTEQEARAAVAASRSYAEALRRLGYRPAGGNPKTLRKYVELWGISTDHFDPRGAVRDSLRRANPAAPLEEHLVADSTYSRHALKQRLYEEGLKSPVCEWCGQGDVWMGRRMALILDHVNGRSTDNRIENLRILCPNCAATLDTHCGRKNQRPFRTIPCARCGVHFEPKYRRQRYCSRECGQRWDRSALIGAAKPALRRVERPAYDQLLREIEETSWVAVGRKYGVSDNAVRKWVRQYERERDAAGAGERAAA
jgi:hypothetical protein